MSTEHDSAVVSTTRRRVLQGLTIVPAGVWLSSALPADALPADAADAANRASDTRRSHLKDLVASFRTPPDDARPWVYWFWVDGNVTLDGITADLEAMQRVGIGGVLIMSVSSERGASPALPSGDFPVATPQWYAALEHVVDETRRLGLEVNISDAPGWSGSGGPWNPTELSQLALVWSEKKVTGGQQLTTTLEQPYTKLGFYRDVVVQAFPTPANDRYRIEETGFKRGSTAYVSAPANLQGIPPMPIDVPEVAADIVIDPARVIDLTDQVSDGTLTWDAPEGEWTVIRFGYTSQGKTNHPVEATGSGLECTKLERAGIENQWDNYVSKVLRRDPRGRSITSVHLDSWEVGDQNWSTDFPERFAKLRGYDPLPRLICYTGRVLGSLEQSERYLWDVRMTIGDLIRDEYIGRLAKLAERSGRRMSGEIYDAPVDQIAAAGRTTEPQTEFWWEADNKFGGTWPPRSAGRTENMASAAHVYGHPIVAAEAFTATPSEGWRAAPKHLKGLGDWAFTSGVNRLIVHRAAMQPWPSNIKPGMTMQYWGQHYDTTQTWWETAGPWHTYLARCQHLLRQGTQVADILYLQPEGSPSRFTSPGSDATSLDPPITPGYNFDGCSPEAVFSRLSVNREGRIVLPDGMSYRVLVLPEHDSIPNAGLMTPRLLRRLGDLVDAGMTLVGPRPVRSPSLEGFPGCDEELVALADHLWGSGAVRSSGSRRVGKGRVVWGSTAQHVLAEAGVGVDFSSGPSNPFRYIHRRLDDGTELYFVANRVTSEITAECEFRVPGRGRSAQLWRPDSGDIEHAVLRRAGAASAGLTLTLQPLESVFVAFPATRGRHSIATSVNRDGRSSEGIDRLTVSADGTTVLESGRPGLVSVEADGAPVRVRVPALPSPYSVEGPWQVTFAPDGGAPEQVTLPELLSWPDHADPGIQHFSGTATYTTTFRIPPAMFGRHRSLWLDLGRVEVHARVRVNGVDLGVLWREPYRVEVGHALRRGTNTLEIEATNLWPNRMIGDEALPEDTQWSPPEPLWKVPGHTWQVPTAIPQWVWDGGSSPTGRHTWATIKVFRATDPLLPSGLIGPVTITPRARIPVRPRNLALLGTASASSTHAGFVPMGANNGNRDSGAWNRGNGWNDDTRSTFPDWYQVTLPRRSRISRVDLYTLDSPTYPAERYGLRDYDVQVQVAGGWRTVAEVRDNSVGQVRSSFRAVTTDAVRILISATHDSWSRIVELEIYR